jgi:hypothetical protein
MYNRTKNLFDIENKRKYIYIYIYTKMNDACKLFLQYFNLQ